MSSETRTLRALAAVAVAISTPNAPEEPAAAPAPAKPDEPKKTLVLHITVPGFYADDLDDCAKEIADGKPTAADRLEVVLEEWMRPEVGITLVSLPGEKSTSDDFEVHAYNGRIVGAELRKREPWDDKP